MNLSMKQKQTHRHREQTGCKGGRGLERDGVRGWGQQMCAIIHRMDKQQGPTVQNRELYSTFCDKP